VDDGTPRATWEQRERFCELALAIFVAKSIAFFHHEYNSQ
jgi:hypothetical protein